MFNIDCLDTRPFLLVGCPSRFVNIYILLHPNKNLFLLQISRLLDTSPFYSHCLEELAMFRFFLPFLLFSKRFVITSLCFKIIDFLLFHPTKGLRSTYNLSVRRVRFVSSVISVCSVSNLFGGATSISSGIFIIKLKLFPYPHWNFPIQHSMV